MLWFSIAALALAIVDTILTNAGMLLALNVATAKPIYSLRALWPQLTRPMIWLTYFGRGYVLFAIMALLALWKAGAGRKREAWVLLGAFIAAWILGLGLKQAIREPRPDIEPPPPPITRPTDFSFPSEHALMTIVVVALAARAISESTAGRMRAVTVAAAAILVFGVGFSRIYLGVHWPNDVLGGYLYGAALAGIAQFLIERWRRPSLFVACE